MCPMQQQVPILPVTQIVSQFLSCKEQPSCVIETETKPVKFFIWEFISFRATKPKGGVRVCRHSTETPFQYSETLDGAERLQFCCTPAENECVTCYKVTSICVHVHPMWLIYIRCENSNGCNFSPALNPFQHCLTLDSAADGSFHHLHSKSL